MTKPSAAETKPKGCPSGLDQRVGKCVKVISTSISPRSAFISQRYGIARKGKRRARRRARASAHRCPAGERSTEPFALALAQGGAPLDRGGDGFGRRGRGRPREAALVFAQALCRCAVRQAVGRAGSSQARAPNRPLPARAARRGQWLLTKA